MPPWEDGRHGVRRGSASRLLILGLVGLVPFVGSGLATALEEVWPSQREREQAAKIAEQPERIEQLEREVHMLDSHDGDRRRRRREAMRRTVGGLATSRRHAEPGPTRTLPGHAYAGFERGAAPDAAAPLA
jgi:hypothetical protein